MLIILKFNIKIIKKQLKINKIKMFELKDPSRCVIDQCLNSIDDNQAGQIRLILYKTKIEPQPEQDFYQYICDQHYRYYNYQDLQNQLLQPKNTPKNTPKNAVSIVRIDEYRIDIAKQHPCVQCHQSKQVLCDKLLELIKYANTPEKKLYLAKSEVIQQFLRDKNLFAQLRMQIYGNSSNEQQLILSYLDNLKRQYRNFDVNNCEEIKNLLGLQ
ncbi:hypothetical protein pb186bvf_011457 [Paramecium bursaria]